MSDASSGNFLQNMAPNAKRSFFAALVFAAVGVVLYLFAVEPASAALTKERTKLGELKDKQNRMGSDLKGASTVKRRLTDMESQLQPFRDALLVPTLGSYAVRAQGILDPLALGAGLTETNYFEDPFRALPLPKSTTPKQLYTRAAIRMTAKGSYQAAISFLLRLERDFPLVTVQTMNISAKGDNAAQAVEFVLEWPAKGDTTVPSGAKGVNAK